MLTHSRRITMAKKGLNGFLVLLALALMISTTAFAQRRGGGGAPARRGPVMGGAQG